MARAEQIYLGTENRVVRELTRNGAPLSDHDKDAITRVQAWFSDTVCLDTDNATDPIEYADGSITMQPGLIAGLEAGEITVHLTVFDHDHDQGLAWGSFPAEVQDWPKCEG